MVNVRIPAQAVNLQHLHPRVTARALGGVTWVVSASAPSSPNTGDLWVDKANDYQLNQWNGSQWFAVPVNAGSLIGENFIINANGQYHYASPPALSTWSFEAGLDGWTAANATALPSDAEFHTGDYSALITYTSGASWSFSSPQQAVEVGNQVYISAWVYAPQALGEVGLQLAWYDSGGTPLSTSSGPTGALAAATWTQFTYNAAPVASAAFCSIIVQDAETSVTGYQMYVDDVFIAGQLAVATAPSEGSDPLGNGHPPGLYTAGSYGTGVTMSTGNALEAHPGNTGVTEEGSGSGQQLGTGLWGPKMTGGTEYADSVSALMFSSQQGAAGTANGALTYTTGAGEQSQPLQWGAGGVTVNNGMTVTSALTFAAGAATAASPLSGGIIISQADNEFTSQANPTTPSRLCKVWPIPAGDPVTGTVYRLSMGGTGVWQGNPLAFQIAGLGETLAPFQVGGDLMSAGLNFMYDLVATMWVSQTGTDGIVAGSIRLSLGVAGANQLPTGGANGAGGFAGASSVDSVSGIGDADSAMTVQVAFASPDSGQSIQSLGSVFERIGGQA